MQNFLIVLALALLPAIGNFAGGLLAEIFPVSRRALGLALHAAAGIVLAVVGVEIMPQALQADPAWIIVPAFIAGGCFFLLMDHFIGIVESRLGRQESAGSPWVIYFGVAMDLFSDGIMIGTGSAISFELALLLAIGQISADIPEGFATIANFRSKGVSRKVRLALSASFFLPILIGASAGYWLVQGRPEFIKLGLLTFTAGILTTLVVEEIIPEAHEEGEARLAALLFICGFALFTWLSLYLG